MDERSFTKLVREKVCEYVNANSDRVGEPDITVDDVYIVWMCKTLRNNKALASTTVEDGMYYELTFNGYRGELYFDAYKKHENICFEGIQNG